MARESEPIRPSTLRDSELPVLHASPVAPDTRKGQRVALGVALILMFLVASWIASSLWVGIVLGAVVAFTTQPLYRKLVAKLGERRRKLAAAIATLVSGLVMLVVGTIAMFILGREMVEIVGVIQSKLTSNASSAQILGPKAMHLLVKAHVDTAQLDARMHELLGKAQSEAAAGAAMVLSTTGTAAVTLIIAIVTEFYVLLDWAALAVRLECILPLDPRHTRALFLEFRDVGRSAFVGTVTTAIVQGTLAAIGYAIAGVPQPVTWGTATAIASLLPVVGTFLVWVPIGAYEIVEGRLPWGIFVLAWGFIIVSAATDYVIRPRLVGQGHAHPLLMLVALIGGIEVMGLAGLIVAPILMSLFLAVLRIYERETKSEAREAMKSGIDQRTSTSRA